jgi:penicillin-binding protein 1A
LQKKREMQPQKPKREVAAPKRRLWLTILKWTGIAGLVGIALGAATIALVFWMYGRDPNLPTIESMEGLRKLLEHPKQVTKILDTNDHEIGEVGSEHRSFLAYDKIPPLVVNAFVAAEDHEFWEHHGVDYFGMARAFVANMRAGHTTQGASTITQQVVKNLLLTPERSFKRKIQEVILARRLETALSKEEILTLYLNETDLGHNTFGVGEAAKLYFGKDITQINIGEAAVLGALPKSPEIYYKELHGGKHPEQIKERQVYVLRSLLKMGKISAADEAKYEAAPIQIYEQHGSGADPEWMEVASASIEDDLKKQVGDDPDKLKDALDHLGAKVRTTLDPAMQKRAETSLRDGMFAYDARHHLGRPLRSIKPDKIDAELARLGKRGAPKPHEPYDAIVTDVSDDNKELTLDLGHFPATLSLTGDWDARYNVDGKKPSERFKKGDVVDVEVPGVKGVKADVAHAVWPVGPEGAVVVMDIKTRKVRALVGGYHSVMGGFDRATMAKRQPGSAFKPFVYATAFDQGKYTPASVVNDAPEVFDMVDSIWKPKNFETGTYEGPVRLRTALAKSINTVSIRVTYDVKPEAVAAMAKQLGIQSELPKEMSLALGAGEVTPLEITNAYATLAAGGVYAPPRFIDAINGKATPDAPGQQVLRPEVAYVTTDMMRSVVTEGTAAEIGAKIKAPIAGKTGTSNEAKDTWFIGMTPDLVIGVWMGRDDDRPMPGEQGAKVAAPVFLEIAKQLDLPAKAFPRPAHVVEALIDRATGLLAPDGAPKATTLNEVFVEGTQPTEVAAKPGEQTEATSVTGEYGD